MHIQDNDTQRNLSTVSYLNNVFQLKASFATAEPKSLQTQGLSDDLRIILRPFSHLRPS